MGGGVRLLFIVILDSQVLGDEQEEDKRTRGGILNISAIIATRPSHAVC